MNKVLYSLIIPTWNRKNKINGIIKSIINQIPKDFSIEIIICDSNTSGLKKLIINNFKNSKKIKLKYLNCIRNSNSLKRNFGIKEAKGKNIIFLDDDCLPDINFFKTYEKIFKIIDKKTIVCGSVKYKFKKNKNNNFIRYRQSRHFVVDNKKLILKKNLKPENIVTMNMAFINSKEIKNTKFFNEKFANYGFEDYEFAIKVLKHKFKIYPCSALVYHLDDRSFKKYLNKIYFLGRFAMKYLLDVDKKSADKLVYRSIEKNKFLKFFSNSKIFYILLSLFEKIIIYFEKVPFLYLPLFYKVAIFISYYKGFVDRQLNRRLLINWYN